MDRQRKNTAEAVLFPSTSRLQPDFAGVDTTVPVAATVHFEQLAFVHLGQVHDRLSSRVKSPELV